MTTGILRPPIRTRHVFTKVTLISGFQINALWVSEWVSVAIIIIVFTDYGTVDIVTATKHCWCQTETCRLSSIMSIDKLRTFTKDYSRFGELSNGIIQCQAISIHDGINLKDPLLNLCQKIPDFRRVSVSRVEDSMKLFWPRLRDIWKRMQNDVGTKMTIQPLQ